MTVYQNFSSTLNAFKSYRLNLEIDLDLEIDLHLVSTTFVYEYFVDIPILYTKIEFHSSNHSKVIDLKITLTLKLTLTLRPLYTDSA